MKEVEIKRETEAAFLNKKNNIVYLFQCSFEDCISDKNVGIYVGLTTTLSKRLTLYLPDASR